MTTIDPIYISAGCNRCAKALDWGGSANQIIFGQSRAVALMTSKDDEFEIKCTFGGHTDTVNCARWIRRALLSDPNTLKEDEFISGSKDKSIIVWRGSQLNYESVQVLTGHTASVNVLDAVYIDTDEGQITTHIASAAVDSTVRIWTRKPTITENFTQEQVLTAKGHGFALALKFHQLPISKSTILLIAYDNHKIDIHVRLDKEEKFELHHTLIGHEDWIQDIDVCRISPTQLLIASCSQDHYIRLWKLDAAPTKLQEERAVVEDKDEANNSDDSDEDENKVPVDEDLKLKSSHFIVYSKRAASNIEYSMSLESVLYGHEDWIYSVRFQPEIEVKGEKKQPLTLISASMDKTMVVWSYNEENAVWIDVARAGDIGGTTLGFYGATFDATGKFIVAHGYQGALHLWSRDLDSKNDASLKPGVINSGHFDAVEEVAWEPEHHYLISTSKDQTSRFHGEWRRDGRSSWHELGRPQIHGYDMQCVAFIDRFRFVSGADEKLLRIFACPLVFLRNYYRLSGDESVKEFIDAPTDTMPKGASVPALGLSNKAVFEQESSEKHDADAKGPNLSEELYKEVYFNVIDLNKPPTEEHLLQNTLWPEMQKLYGHGYELFSVACEPRSRLIASACKASKPEHARILLWQQQQQSNTSGINSQQFKQVGELPGHELTIVQLKFSPSGRLLLSVSRDRSWKLFVKTSVDDKGEVSMQLVNGLATKNPYHTRIVWSCDWSHDERYFVTTSRDKRVCVWETQEAIGTSGSPAKPIIAKAGGSDLWLELSDSVTASAFAPDFATDSKNYLLAFGLDNGTIEIYKWNPQDGFSKYAQVENRFSHHMTVKRLTFRKQQQLGDDKSKTFCLASCSDDFSVRLFNIHA